MTTQSPIGTLKSKVTKSCTICGCNIRRSIKSDVYEKTPEKIEIAKAELRKKAAKPYTCRICIAIAKDM